VGVETYPSPSIGTNRKSNLTPCFRGQPGNCSRRVSIRRSREVSCGVSVDFMGSNTAQRTLSCEVGRLGLR
jgi:hypothetical protein